MSAAMIRTSSDHAARMRHATPCPVTVPAAPIQTAWRALIGCRQPRRVPHRRRRETRVGGRELELGYQGQAERAGRRSAR